MNKTQEFRQYKKTLVVMVAVIYQQIKHPSKVLMLTDIQMLHTLMTSKAEVNLVKRKLWVTLGKLMVQMETALLYHQLKIP